MRQPWVKIHREMLANPKYGTLSADARLVFYELLLCSEDDGALPTIKEIAWMTRRLPAEVGVAVDELVSVGWMEWDGANAPKFLHWAVYQGKGKSSTQRSKERRQRLRNVAATLQQRKRNAPDAEEEVEKEEEKEGGNPPAPACEDSPETAPPSSSNRRKKKGNGPETAWGAYVRGEIPDDPIAQQAWQRCNGPYLLACVRRGQEKEQFAAQRFARAYMEVME